MASRRVLLPLLLSGLLAGCATSPQATFRLYAGEPRSESQIAKLWFDEAKQTLGLFGYSEWVQLRALVGATVKEETNSKREYHLLPGHHRLTVRFVYYAGVAQGLIETLITQAVQESSKRTSTWMQEKAPSTRSSSWSRRKAHCPQSGTGMWCIESWTPNPATSFPTSSHGEAPIRPIHFHWMRRSTSAEHYI